MDGLFDTRFPGSPMGLGLPPGVTALTDPFTPVPRPRPLVPPVATPTSTAGEEEPSPGGGEGGPIGSSSIKTQGEDGGGSAGGFNSDKLIQGLRGAAAPKAPDVVKPSTPALPRPTPIHSGELLAMLNALSNPRAAAMAARPTTLGGALGIGRY